MKIKVNANACTGCRLCRQVCAIEKFNETNPRKARLRIEASFPSPGKFRPRVCVQCGKCAEACPENAIYKDERGVYIVDDAKCTACGICIDTCPFGVMMSWKGGTAYKCDFCWRCTEVCNTGAITQMM